MATPDDIYQGPVHHRMDGDGRAQGGGFLNQSNSSFRDGFVNDYFALGRDHPNEERSCILCRRTRG
jgi:hypothetical protein